MIPTNCKVLEVERGAWVGDTTGADVPDGTFELGSRTWTGTVLTSAKDGTNYHARIVGGKGKLGTQLPEKPYLGSIRLETVAADIIRECGEVAGSIASATVVPSYERARGTAGQALNELCDAGGLVWWVSRDGRVNVATGRPTASAFDATKVQQTGADVDGAVTLNVETADDVQPGMLSGSSVIRAIYWRLSSRELVAECSPFQPALPDSRGKEFYLKTYSAKVHQQNADGSVDVIANGLFSMNRVPLLAGLPGVAVTVKPGELVAVGFLGGNRSTPYAMGFGQLAAAAAQLALNGDTVTMLLPPFALTGTALIGGVPTAITGVMTALTGQTLGTITGPSSARTKSK